MHHFTYDTFIKYLLWSSVFTEIHQGLCSAGLCAQPRQPFRKRLLRPALLRPQPSDREYSRCSSAPLLYRVSASFFKPLLHTLKNRFTKTKPGHKECLKKWRVILFAQEGLNVGQGDESSVKEKHDSNFSIIFYQCRRDLCLCSEPQNLSGLVFPIIILLSSRIYCIHNRGARGMLSCVHSYTTSWLIYLGGTLKESSLSSVLIRDTCIPLPDTDNRYR